MSPRSIAWEGLTIGLHDDVYEPGDDTWMLAKAVAQRVRPGDLFLEVGCGTGVATLAAARAGARCLAVDRNPHAAATASRNAHRNGLEASVLVTDLLQGLRAQFDVIAFNPPYLPTGDDDHVEGPLDWAFDGGPDGTAVVARFLQQLEHMALRPREVLVVHSSAADAGPLEAAMTRLGYRGTVLAAERHFFETITVRSFVVEA